MSDTMEFRIQEVSEKLQLPTSTIRYWENEFPEHLKPKRTNGGQRRYSTENISIIEVIKGMREKGMSLASIKRRLDGGDTSGMQDSSDIDLLASRVADLVRTEVAVFLKSELDRDIGECGQRPFDRNIDPKDSDNREAGSL